jgi:hypothetical protein
MMFGGSWIVDNVPARPSCKILPDPNSFVYCGRPSGDRTVLDLPICDVCWEAIAYLEGESVAR